MGQKIKKIERKFNIEEYCEGENNHNHVWETKIDKTNEASRTENNQNINNNKKESIIKFAQIKINSKIKNLNNKFQS